MIPWLKPKAALVLACTVGTFVTGLGVGLTLGVADRNGAMRRQAAAFAEWMSDGLDAWSGDDDEDYS